jgi:hypothetical protein
MNMINTTNPPWPVTAEDEIGTLARKIGRDWAKPRASRSGSGGSVTQRMPHGRSRSVAVEIKRSRRTIVTE